MTSHRAPTAGAAVCTPHGVFNKNTNGGCVGLDTRVQDLGIRWVPAMLAFRETIGGDFRCPLPPLFACVLASHQCGSLFIFCLFSDGRSPRLPSRRKFACSWMGSKKTCPRMKYYSWMYFAGFETEVSKIQRISL